MPTKTPFQRIAYSLPIIAALLAVSCPPVSAGTVALGDKLPSSHWTLDALAYLASRVKIEGLPSRAFIGNYAFAFGNDSVSLSGPDRRISRDEAARIVIAISEAAKGKQLSERATAWLAALQQEFAAEIKAVSQTECISFSPTKAPEAAIAISGYRQGRMRWKDDDDSATYLSKSTFAYMSPGFQALLSFADERRRDDPENRFSELDRAWLNWKAGGYDFGVGRDYVYWGPSYSGSMLLGDNAQPFDQIRISKEFYLGKTFGRVRISQFASMWEERPAGFDTRLYLIGRRYQWELSPNWQLGISETMKMSRRPNAFAAVLPFYLYQEIFSGQDEKINEIYALDVRRTFGASGEAYLDFIVDAWTAPDFLVGTEITERKAGLLLGGAIFSRRKPLPDSFRLELFTIDPGAFAQPRPAAPELAWNRKGIQLGYPTGPNNKGFFIRADKWLSNKLELTAEFKNAYSRDKDVFDFHYQRIGIGLVYDFSPRTSAALRYGRARIRTDVAGMETSERDRVIELAITRTN